MNSAREELVNVYYFSAYAIWLPGPYSRHKKFVDALKSRGVTPILSNFKEHPNKCRNCGIEWTSHEEKETDVQIAIHLIKNVYEGQSDKILSISADSDLIPAVKMVMSVNPNLPVHLLVPPGRWKRAHALQVIASSATRIKVHHLERNLLPEEINQPGNIIHRPSEYDPPQ